MCMRQPSSRLLTGASPDGPAADRCRFGGISPNPSPPPVRRAAPAASGGAVACGEREVGNGSCTRGTGDISPPRRIHDFFRRRGPHLSDGGWSGLSTWLPPLRRMGLD